MKNKKIKVIKSNKLLTGDLESNSDSENVMKVVNAAKAEVNGELTESEKRTLILDSKTGKAKQKPRSVDDSVETVPAEQQHADVPVVQCDKDASNNTANNGKDKVKMPPKLKYSDAQLENAKNEYLKQIMALGDPSQLAPAMAFVNDPSNLVALIDKKQASDKKKNDDERKTNSICEKILTAFPFSKNFRAVGQDEKHIAICKVSSETKRALVICCLPFMKNGKRKADGTISAIKAIVDNRAINLYPQLEFLMSSLNSNEWNELLTTFIQPVMDKFCSVARHNIYHNGYTYGYSTTSEAMAWISSCPTSNSGRVTIQSKFRFFCSEHKR